MPKINITERDLSWYARQGAGSLVIYVPGVSISGPVDRPVLCHSISDFKQIFGGPVSGDSHNSYEIAASFIKAGASVLFQRFVNSKQETAQIKFNVKNKREEVSDVSGGLLLEGKYPGSYLNGFSCSAEILKTSVVDHDDIYVHSVRVKVYDKSDSLVENVTLTSSNYYDSDVSKYFLVNREQSSELFESYVSHYDPETGLTPDGGDVYLETKNGKDKDSFEKVAEKEVQSSEIRIEESSCLFDPYFEDFHFAVSCGFGQATELDLLKVAKTRGNCLLIVDGNKDDDPPRYYTHCEGFDSSFAVGVGPWGYASLLSTGEVKLLPGSYAFLIQWIKSVSEGVPVWMAPAGVKRATLGSFYVKPQYEVGKSVLDAWQHGDKSGDESAPDYYKVNPIMKVKNYGYVVYGNSTLLHNSPEGKTSMLQSLSTRVAVNEIRREAFNISLGLQFDQMGSDLYVQFKTLMGAYLDQMKYQGAIYDYRVVIDTSTVSVGDLNERRVPVKIQISPNSAAENFDIDLEITKAGITFSDDIVSD